MNRVAIKYIDSLNELSPSEKCVLVAFGKSNALVQEGERFIILSIPSHSRINLLTGEGIETIFLFSRLIRLITGDSR